MQVGQSLSRIAHYSKPVMTRAIDASLSFLLPPLCGSCDIVIDAPGLCVSCFQKMRAISEPKCKLCGRPLALILPDSLCGACLIDKPPLRRIRSAYHYNDASRALLLPFKHAGQIQMASTLTSLMRQDFSEIYEDGHIIIPIPLHWRRLIHRRYNQSAEIARRLCQLRTHDGRALPQYAPHFLKRQKATTMLRGKSALQRRLEVKAAFRIPKQANLKIRNKPILLIDDVMTTGATLYEAARTLKRGGAGPIDALCFARVL